jgi:hypothetical protein
MLDLDIGPSFTRARAIAEGLVVSAGQNNGVRVAVGDHCCFFMKKARVRGQQSFRYRQE